MARSYENLTKWQLRLMRYIETHIVRRGAINALADHSVYSLLYRRMIAYDRDSDVLVLTAKGKQAFTDYESKDPAFRSNADADLTERTANLLAHVRVMKKRSAA